MTEEQVPPQPSQPSKRNAAWAARLLPMFGSFLIGALIFGVWCGTSRDHAPPDAHDHAATTEVWTCSMHPQIRQPEAGACPICGMDLIPVPSNDGSGDVGADQVALSERAKTLAKLRTVRVTRQSDAAAQVALLGRVEPNETTRRAVTAWTGGRIDRLHVNVTGQKVRAGQVIATLYSPEVFAAHQDLLAAKQQVERMTSSAETARRAAVASLEAARQRLRLLGVPDDELARMENAEEPTQAVKIRTPYAGTVIERVASEGAYVAKGAPLYRVADLRTLWVQLDAYESDLPRIAVGQPVRVQVDALPSETFDGKLTFIDPTLDARRRTARVRVEVDNADGRLRPGMFAKAIVTAAPNADDRSPLVVPSTAPLFTGRRAIVYVEVSSDDRSVYEPRTVLLGPRLGDVYPVVAGLSEGETIVARGAFAVDADLQIRGGASMMMSPDDDDASESVTAIAVSDRARGLLAPVVSAYLDVQVALAKDRLKEAQTAAEALERAAVDVAFDQPPKANEVWRVLAPKLRTNARRIARARDLETARSGFEGLSDATADLLRQFGNPLGAPIRLAFCPMAQGSKGASWFQQDEKIDNAYFGASMRTCGEIKEALAPGAYLGGASDVKSRPASRPAGGHKH